MKRLRQMAACAVTALWSVGATAQIPKPVVIVNAFGAMNMVLENNDVDDYAKIKVASATIALGSALSQRELDAIALPQVDRPYATFLETTLVYLAKLVSDEQASETNRLDAVALLRQVTWVCPSLTSYVPKSVVNPRVAEALGKIGENSGFGLRDRSEKNLLRR